MKKKKRPSEVVEEPVKKKKKKKTVEVKDEGFGDKVANPFKADWKFMLSTGSTLLDLAISGKRKKFGGIPTGILVEIAGKSGTGKCFSRNNYITSFDGVFSVNEYFDKLGNPAYKVTKPPFLLEKGKFLLTNMLGEKEGVVALTFNGLRHLKRISTNNGITHEITLNHPLRVMTENGNIIWKQAKDIKIGEFLIYRGGFLRESTESEKQIKSIAYIAGLYVADGYLCKNTGFTNNEPFILKKVTKFMKDNDLKFYLKDRVRGERYSTTEINLSSNSGGKKLRELLHLNECKSAGKEIPLLFRTSGREVAVSFLRGYVDCEGYFTRNSLEVTSASKTLLDQVQQLLIGLGIFSSLNKKIVLSYKNNDYWRLNVTGENFSNYMEIIGTSLNSRREQSSGFEEDRGGYSTSDIIPFQKEKFRDFVFDVLVGKMNREDQSVFLRIQDNLTKTKVFKIKEYLGRKGIPIAGTSKIILDEWENIIENKLMFSQVTSNDLIEKDWTYDVSMEKTSSFLLNGCISHNTQILTELCASAQGRGGQAYFNDPEARLDKEYAAITGYSLTDEKLYDRPDTVTQLFTNFRDWNVDPTVPNVFAGDSLAALSTDMEMEDEDKMGMRRAKELSEGLRKHARLFAKKNILMVCSNQLRDSTTGKTTPGGNAVPFYSSVRLEVMPHFPASKIKREKTINGVKHSKVIGIHSDVTVIKNSLDDPFRKVPIYIIFGYGIDDIRGNLTWMKESRGDKKITFDNKEFSRIEDAIQYVEENALEKKLKKEVVDLWKELEEAFKTTRKPKTRN